MADQIHIRECREDEGQTVLDLWSQAGDVVTSPTDTLDDVIAAIRHNAASFLVAECQGRIVAIIIGTWDG